MKSVRVGISYATEQQEEVKLFVKELKRLKINYFYDEEHPELFWGEFAPEVLNQIYEGLDAVVVFISSEYGNKPLPRFEMQTAFYAKLHADTGEKYFLPILYDGAQMPVYFHGYFYLPRKKYTIPEIAEILAKRLRTRKTSTPTIKTVVRQSLKKYESDLEFVKLENSSDFTIKSRADKKINLLRFVYDKKQRLYYVLDAHDNIKAAMETLSQGVSVFNYGLFGSNVRELSYKDLQTHLTDLWSTYDKN